MLPALVWFFLPLVATLLWASGLTAASTRAVPKADFRGDIQPPLAGRCMECHGREDESSEFRFDRRGSVQKNPKRCRRDSSATSLVYPRVASDEFGSQMPKDDTLRPEDIALIKEWIGQGPCSPTSSGIRRPSLPIPRPLE